MANALAVPVAFFVAMLITWSMIAITRRTGVVASPDHRSSHSRPTPTLGGVAIVLPAIGWAALVRHELPVADAILLGGSIVAAVGAIDDIRNLPARVRFPVHVVATAAGLWAMQVGAVSVFGVTVPASWPLTAGLALALVWFLNLYNFMDGIDGIAGMQCVTFGVGVALLAQTPDPAVVFALVLASAALGFLVFNWAPARIFMGDVGSGFLGLTIGLIALELQRRNLVPLVASMVLLVPFWFDATYTLCARIVTRQAFTAPHRSHAYQKIARRFGHGWTTSINTLITVVWLAPLAWWATRSPDWAPTAFALAMVPYLAACVSMRAGVPERD